MKRCLCITLIFSLLFTTSVFAYSNDNIKNWSKNFQENGTNWDFPYAGYTRDTLKETFGEVDIEPPEQLGVADKYKLFASLSGEYMLMRIYYPDGKYYIISVWDKDEHCIDYWTR